jgi:hypothetical protein
MFRVLMVKILLFVLLIFFFSIINIKSIIILFLKIFVFSIIDSIGIKNIIIFIV